MSLRHTFPTTQIFGRAQPLRAPHWKRCPFLRLPTPQWPPPRQMLALLLLLLLLLALALLLQQVALQRAVRSRVRRKWLWSCLPPLWGRTRMGEDTPFGGGGNHAASGWGSLLASAQTLAGKIVHEVSNPNSMLRSEILPTASARASAAVNTVVNEVGCVQGSVRHLRAPPTHSAALALTHSTHTHTRQYPIAHHSSSLLFYFL